MKGDLYFLCGMGSSIVVFHEKRGGVCNLSLFLGMSPVEDERKVDSNSSDVMHLEVGAPGRASTTFRKNSAPIMLLVLDSKQKRPPLFPGFLPPLKSGILKPFAKFM